MTDSFEDWAVKWIIYVLLAIVFFWVGMLVAAILPAGFMLPVLFLIVRLRWRIRDEDETDHINWDKELRALTKAGRL